jgi:mannose-1-phosphate guanylyltransferase
MVKPVKGLILAAGFGTRLKPITLTCPKCLVTVGNKPILEHWLAALQQIDCSEVIINTHYLFDKVEEYLAWRPEKQTKVSTSYEKQILGTAGTLKKLSSLLRDSTVVMMHSDNFSDIELSDVIRTHNNRPEYCMMTMVVFSSSEPSNCGIVEVDDIGVVQGFHEKVESPPGNLANGAIYIFDAELIDFVNGLDGQIIDFSLDVLPKLMGKIYIHKTDGTFIDIGTPTRLAEARKACG